MLSARLREFAEDRYLHQTTRFLRGARQFHEDLQELCQRPLPSREARGEWRVHFHVPLFYAEIPPLMTTRAETARCLEFAREALPHADFEVETYAWHVLPADLRELPLAQGIAQELAWAADHLSAE